MRPRRDNLDTLRRRGVRVVKPGSGYLACGMIGAGRLAEPEQIVEAVLGMLGVAQDLKGESVLVTAGPTFEPIDPVRFIGNRSSGKMGYAIAEAAIRRGARVTLVSGPTAINPPAVAEFVPVETTAQMRDAVLLRFPDASVVIKAAAVADYRPRQTAAEKIKRAGSALTLELEPTADILAELGAHRFDRQILIGFAAETENVIDNARRKLAAKHIDAIVVNDVSKPGIGFNSDRNAVTIITAEDSLEVPESGKFEVAQRVLDTVVRLRASRLGSSRSLGPSRKSGEPMKRVLEPETRAAIAERLRFYRDLGVYDFYRRPVSCRCARRRSRRRRGRRAVRGTRQMDLRLQREPMKKTAVLDQTRRAGRDSPGPGRLQALPASPARAHGKSSSEWAIPTPN